jgi:hypothetical protein
MDLERLRYKNGEWYIDLKDSWNIARAYEKNDGSLHISLRDVENRACGYTLVPEDVVWNLCGKIYRLRNNQEVFDFYSAVQSMLESRAIDEALK